MQTSFSLKLRARKGDGGGGATKGCRNLARAVSKTYRCLVKDPQKEQRQGTSQRRGHALRVGPNSLFQEQEHGLAASASLTLFCSWKRGGRVNQEQNRPYLQSAVYVGKGKGEAISAVKSLTGADLYLKLKSTTKLCQIGKWLWLHFPYKLFQIASRVKIYLF